MLGEGRAYRRCSVWRVVSKVIYRAQGARNAFFFFFLPVNIKLRYNYYLTHSVLPAVGYFAFCILHFVFCILYCVHFVVPNGNVPHGKFGGRFFPKGKPAAAESRYPTLIIYNKVHAGVFFFVFP